MAVTSTNNLKKGSSGSDVLDLQKRLNSTDYGYNLAEDGIFGDKTLAAVKDYQQRSGLTVDGIVGTNTWGALTKPQTSTTTTTPAQTEIKAPTFDYTKSDTAAQKDALVEQHNAQKPGEFSYSLQAGWDDIMNQILNREKFSYDLNGDALYQQYKDQYTTQGKLAMMDTMGQASAMTGGYGNSYAQSVGQQAYQGYLQQLNDKVPELYQLALDQYNREGEDLYNQYALYADRYNQEYGVHRDTVTDWKDERDYLTNDARYTNETEYNQALDKFNIDYGAYRDSVADDQWNQSFQYQKDRDTVADQQWQATFDEGVRQFDLSYNEDVRQYNTSQSQSSGSVTDSVSKNVINKAAGYTNNTDLANYLDGLVESGSITEAQADALYAENKQAEKAALSERDWVLTDDGGINLFGIDNNAKVKDQYGNEYRLDKLVSALVAEGMDKKAAKDYVKKLQAQLGA